MSKMLNKAEEHKKKRITVGLIKQIYNAPTADEADKCIALIPNEKGKYWYVYWRNSFTA